MSPIGRVFIVINLVLAGAFVFMAGTFLQKHTDYKAQFDAKVSELAEVQTSADADRSRLEKDFNEKDRELGRTTTLLERTKADNSSLEDDNQRQESQLADMSADLKSLTSRAATMAEAIDRSAAQSRQSYDMAMEAVKDRESALNEKEAAEASFAGAQRKIGNLEGQLAEANAQVAELDQSNKEQGVLIALARQKYPNVFTLAQPDLRGVVEQAEANICTVRVTDNPGEVDIKPGYTFAIFRGQTYKGEAMVTDVDGTFAFCRITGTQDGQAVSAGDNAATNVGY